MYCGDCGITDGLTLSLLSLLENNTARLNVHILTAACSHGEKQYYPIGQETAAELRGLAKKYNPANTVTLTDLSTLFKTLPLSANLGTRFTPLCMLRLFADLVPTVPDKILYLDCDVLCLSSIEELYDTDIEDYEFGGVLDRYGSIFFRKNVFRRDYVNSGVLLLNMKKIRKSGLFENCRKMCATKKMLMPDQSAINKLSKAKLILPEIYNEQKAEQDGTVLRHFTTYFKFFPRFRAVTVKPWQRERMHKVLNNHNYDGLLDKMDRLKEEQK